MLASAVLSVAMLAWQHQDLTAERDVVDYETGKPEQSEWVFARLHWPPGEGRYARFWRVDYPEAEHHLTQGVRRLTRVQANAGDGIVVDLDSDEIFNWPWIYSEHMNNWHPTAAQAKRLREYLLRGGFFMLDDIHEEYEWEDLVAGLRMVFPDRPIEELNSDDQLFQVLYDLDRLLQVPRVWYIERRIPTAHLTPHWRAIRDDHGRIMVAISYNSDVGDAWEFADNPEYPEYLTSFAYRLAINYLIYSMTH